MNKLLGKRNYMVRYRAVAMTLVLAMVLTYILPAGISGAFGENAAGASREAASHPGIEESTENSSAPAVHKDEDDDGAAPDISTFEVPDFGNVFGAPADDNLKLAPIPDIRDGSAPDGGMENAPADPGITSLSEAVVNDWQDLRTAMNDSNVTKITFGGNISRDGNGSMDTGQIIAQANDLPQISRDLEIDGAGFTLDCNYLSNSMNRPTFVLAINKNATFTLRNLAVTKTCASSTYPFIGQADNSAGTAYHYSTDRGTAQGDYSQNWKINIDNVWQSQPDPENPVMFPGTVNCGLIGACDAKVTFSGRVSWSSNSDTRLVNVRDITFTGTSVADFAAVGNGAGGSNATIWMYASRATRPDNLTIQDGASVQIYSKESQALIVGSMDDGVTSSVNSNFPVANINISGENTLLHCYGDGNFGGQRNNPSNPGIVDFKGGTGTVNIMDGAKLIIESRNVRNAMPGLVVQMPASNTNISDPDSLLRITAESSGGYSAGILFRFVGAQTLNISDHGRAEIIYWPHPGEAATAALRFGGGADNKFFCRSGGSVYIYNGGNESVVSGGTGDTYGNKAVEFGNNSFTFDVQGYKSAVEIVSDMGYGIGASNYQNGVINCKDQAVFSVTGRTNDASGADAGIFRAGDNLKITIDDPLYFDFTNTRPGGGQVIYVSGGTQSFISANTSLSLWRRGEEAWNAAPWRSWIDASLTLSGANLATAVSGTPIDVKNTFVATNISSYTRLSGNNSRVVISDILPVTNADKYVRALAEVPEGLEQIGRPAFMGEVSCLFKVTPTGGSPYTIKASSVESELVYGEAKKGVLRGELPAPYYLEPDDKVEVVDAWIGPVTAKDPGSNDSYTQSNPEDITDAVATVEDKSPPLPGAITTQTLYANKDRVDGTWSLDAAYNPEPPVKLVAYRNGVLIKEGGAAVYGAISGSGSNGVWTYTIPSSCNIEAGDLIQFALEDAAGNRVGLAPATYHDRSFGAAPGITVQPVRYDITCDDVYIGTTQAVNLDPNDPATFIDINKVKGYDLSQPVGSQDTAVDVDASAWTTEWETWAGWPPHLSKTYELTYSIVSDPSFTKTARITVVNAEKVGTGYGIGASRIDYINPEKAKAISDTELISLAKAFAFDVIDGESAEIEVASRDFPADGTACGIGSVTFRVAEEPDTVITVDVVVSRKTPPVLTVINPYFIPTPTVTQDDSVYMTSVSAIDAEDGDITGKVTTDGAVDTTKPGVYKVKYSVTDSDGNKVTAIRTVTVGGKIIGPFILEAQDFVIANDDVVTSPAAAKDEQIISRSAVSVYDFEGNPTTGAIILVASDGGYRALRETDPEAWMDFPVSLRVQGYEEPDQKIDITGRVIRGAVGDNYTLTAKDFHITYRQAVNATDNELIEWAKAKAWKNSDWGAAASVEVVSNGIPANPVMEESYPVVLRIGEEPSTVTTVYCTIERVSPPAISFDTPVEIALGAEFDPMEGVSAEDPIDEDITGRVQIISNDVDTAAAGVYKIVYGVTNSNNLYAERTRVVVVNDGSFAVGGGYIVKASNFLIRTSDVADSGSEAKNAQIIARSGARAYDGVTGEEVDAVVVSDGGYRKLTGPETEKDFTISIRAGGGNEEESGEGHALITVKAKAVKKDVVVSSNGYAVAGNNFRINPVDETGVSDAELLSRASAAAWKLDKDLTPLTPRFCSYDGSRAGEDGLFALAFDAAEGSDGPIGSVAVDVNGGSSPLLAVSSPAIVAMGDSFDYGDKVYAADAEDGEITSKVTWDETVDTDIAGIYKVVYSVTDSDYNTTEATRVVVVQDDSLIIGDEYILQARNFAIRMEDVTATDDEIFGRSMAKAWVKETGAPADDQLVVVSDSGYKDEAKTNSKDYAITVGVDGDAAARNEIIGKVIKKDIIGENAYYIITADNVSIPQSVAKIQLSPLSKLLGLANVQALKKSDMTETPAQLGTNNINIGATGSYTANYAVAADPGVSVQGMVDITKGASPSISLDPTTDTVAVGSAAEYGYMDGVSASDPEDGDITGKVAVTGSVDMNKAGVYTVTYSVEDADGNDDSRIRVVVVNDGAFIATPSYILRARSFVIRGSEVEGADIPTQIIDKSQARAWDAVTGAETDAVALSTGGYGPDQDTYDIVIAVDADRSVTRSVKATVVTDETAVDAGDYWIVGNPIKINSMTDKALPHPDFVALGKVRAFKADDSLTPGTPALDSYTGNYDGAQGDFFAGFHVAEEPSNKLEGLKVTVTDGQKPTLRIDPVFVNLDKGADPLAYEDYMAGISAKDAEDTPAGKPLVITYEGVVDTEVSGVYPITYSVTDSDFNTVTKLRYYAVGTKIHFPEPYFMYSEDYMINSGDVIASPTADRDAQILAASKASVYDSAMEPTTGAIVFVADAGGYRQLEEGEGAKVFTVRLALDKAPGETTPVKVMVGNNVVTGDRYSIAANDFSISMGEVKSVTEANLINWAQAKAFRNSDFSGEVVRVTDHNILRAPGEYSVTFQVANEPGTRTTVKMHVSSVPAPTIDLDSPVRLGVGEPFDPLQGVRAEDYLHKDITANVQVTSNNVNTYKPGVYQVGYMVRDDYGNETTACRAVAVNDGSYAVGDRYIVHAVNFVINSSDVDIMGKEAQIKAKAGIKAWDALTGEEVPAVVKDDGGYRSLTDTEEEQDFTIVAGAALDAGTPAPGQAIRPITAKVINKTVVVGENYTIAANRFTINPVDETGITDAELIARAGGEAWMNSDFSPAQVEVGGYTGSRMGDKGLFDLTLNVTAEKTTRITAPVSVTEGNKPVLTVTPASIGLPLNAVFDPMAGVSAADAEDDIAGIPLEISFAAIGDAVDTSAKGVYKVRYSVTDSDHNTVTADRVVAVGLAAGAKYYLDAGNFTLLLKDATGTEEEILARSGAKAWDKSTGAQVSGAILRVADSGGYRQEAGEYPITIGVKGDTPTKGLTGRIVDGDEITVTPGYTIVAGNVSLPRSVAQASFDNTHLLSWAKVRAWRNSDGAEVAAKVKAHTVDVNATGSYKADYAVTEDASGKAEISAKVDITDGVPPTLTVKPDPDEVTAGSGPYDYMNGVTAIDDEDGDITGKVRVGGDTVDTGKAGVYKVTYAVTDSDGNEAADERLVVVNNGNYYITRDYALYANSYVVRAEDVATGAALKEGQILEKSAAKAWNLTTHQEMDVAVIGSGGYKGAADTYTAALAVAADNNVRKDIKITVVDEGNVREGENYFIVGNAIRMNPTVDRTRPDLVKSGKVKAFRKDYNLTPADVSMDSYDGNFDGTQGTFHAAFSVDDEKDTKLDLEVLVSGFSPPWIKVPASPTEIKAGTPFNAMEGVTAGDDEDGDITGKVKVSGDTVDTGSPGVYKLTYTVTDSDYNTVSADRVIVVSDGTYGIGKHFIVRAKNFVLGRSEVDAANSHEQIIDKSGAMAWDAVTGEEAPAAILDDGGYYMSDGSEVQSFNIRIGAEGDSAALPEEDRATVDILATVYNDLVTGNDFPVLTVEPNPDEVEVGSGEYDYMKGVSATDTEDDAASIPVAITYTGEADTSQAGVYQVIYTATDSDGNQSQTVRAVVVNDGSIVSGPNHMLKAVSFSASVMDITGGTDEILDLSGARAWHKDGAPAVPKVKSSGGYKRAGGFYAVTIGVAGNNGAPSMSIYANISADSYTVTFDGNGANAQASPGSMTVTQPSSRISALPVAPTRTGYSFVGWNTAKDGSGAKFAASMAVKSNMTVYAQWAVTRYKLSFNLNGGKGMAPSAQSIDFGTLAKTVKDPKHGKKGFTFKGWNTAKNGSGTYWNFQAERMPAMDVTLYAQWLKPNEIIKEVVVEDPRIKVEKLGGSDSGQTAPQVTPRPTGPVVTPLSNNPPAFTLTPPPIDVTPTEQVEPYGYDMTDPGTNFNGAADTGFSASQEEKTVYEVGGWSVADMLLTGIGMILVVFGLIALALRRKITGFHPGIMNIAGVVMATFATVCNTVILLQEDFSGPVNIAGKFTLIMIFVLVMTLMGVITGLVRTDSKYGRGIMDEEGDVDIDEEW